MHMTARHTWCGGDVPAQLVPRLLANQREQGVLLRRRYEVQAQAQAGDIVRAPAVVGREMIGADILDVKDAVSVEQRGTGRFVQRVCSSTARVCERSPR
jgi:hypothetical protein